MNENVEQLLDWFRKYGVKRGDGQNNAKWKISISAWLDPLIQLLEQTALLDASIDGKACLGFLGASQTGKSAALTYYLNGKALDGSDSLVTWGGHNTLFGTPPQGAGNTQAVILNPFNGFDDASGLCNRLIIKGEQDGVNVDYPVEIKFTTRRDIAAALALGFYSEVKMERGPFKSADIREILEEEKRTRGPGKGDLIEGYLLLKDFVDVIDWMRRITTLFRFRNQEDWEQTERMIIESGCDIEAAERIMGQILWDSDARLTCFYKTAVNLLDELQNEWKDCQILASMEVTRLLLDISSFSKYKKFKDIRTSDPEIRRFHEDISNLRYRKEGREIHLFLDRNAENGVTFSEGFRSLMRREKNGKVSVQEDPGKSFGMFQALCSELVIPLREKHLAGNPAKEQFYHLIRSNDLIDFPGVGGNMDKLSENNNMLDPAKKNLTDEDIITRIFKRGKTLTIFHNYLKSYRLGAVSLMARCDINPVRPEVLNAGIAEWQRSFQADWMPGDPAVMPIFVNTTFAAMIFNAVQRNGADADSFGAYVRRLQNYTCAKPVDNVNFFLTTYHSLPPGQLESNVIPEYVTSQIMGQTEYIEETKLSMDNIKAVFGKDGGQEYMFGEINKIINPEKRRKMCEDILEKDWQAIESLFKLHLPVPPEDAARERSEILGRCAKMLDNVTPKTRFDLSAKLAKTLTDLFSADCEVLKNLSPNLSERPPMDDDADVVSYVNGQLDLLRDTKIDKIMNERQSSENGIGGELTAAHGGDEVPRAMTGEEMIAITEALRDSFGEWKVNLLARMIETELSRIDNNGRMASWARKRLAFAVTNLYLADDAEPDGFDDLADEEILVSRSDSFQGESDPEILKDFASGKASPYLMVIDRLKDRIGALSHATVRGSRPDQPGDNELTSLYHHIMQQSNV